MYQEKLTLNVMLAGATGLIGSQLLPMLTQHESIAHVHLLSRKRVNESSDKISQHVSDTLQLNDAVDNTIEIDVGYICLGTTKKQAGSNEELYKVDVELVTRVATLMKNLGAKKIVVVSSIGAKSSSWSHYLRCKGIMESNIMALNFTEVIFMQPGPLVGIRAQPRKDEIVLQKIMNIFSRFMFGYLANFIPINANLVANRMLERSLVNVFASNKEEKATPKGLVQSNVQHVNTSQMHNK